MNHTVPSAATVTSIGMFSPSTTSRSTRPSLTATISPDPAGNGQPPVSVTRYSSPYRAMPVGTASILTVSFSGSLSAPNRWMNRVVSSSFEVATPFSDASVTTGDPSSANATSKAFRRLTLFSGTIVRPSSSGPRAGRSLVSGSTVPSTSGNVRSASEPKCAVNPMLPSGETPTSGAPDRSPASRPLGNPDTTRPTRPSGVMTLTPAESSF